MSDFTRIEQRFDVWDYDEVLEKVRGLLAEGWFVKTLSAVPGDEERLTRVYVVMERETRYAPFTGEMIERALSNDVEPLPLS